MKHSPSILRSFHYVPGIKNLVLVLYRGNAPQTLPDLWPEKLLKATGER